MIKLEENGTAQAEEHL